LRLVLSSPHESDYTMSVLFIDFETKSRRELIRRSLHSYATDPSTDFTCMAYAFDDEPVKLIKQGDKLPDEVVFHILSRGTVVAHNVAFEWNIWNKVCVPKHSWPELPIDICHCTMAMANYSGFMSSLENAAISTGIEHKKDIAGSRAMMATCKPQSDGKFLTPESHPEIFETLYRYCKQDVEVERQLYKKLRKLPPKEYQIWLADREINERGFEVDVTNAKKLSIAVEVANMEMLHEFKELTGGQVPTPASHAALKKWLLKYGIETKSVDKQHVADLLEADENELDQNKKLPDYVIKALKIRRQYAKNSTAKMQVMCDLADSDSRIRNTFFYYGAKQTGRWAGRDLQPHNFPRGNLDEAQIEEAIEILGYDKTGETFGKFFDVKTDGASLIRPMIRAKKGHKLLVSDWSAIEGRGLAWLAGEEWVLDHYRKLDADEDKKVPDAYKMSYAAAYGIEPMSVNKDQRQLGKIMELAFGYQGAVGSFHSMAKNYGVVISDAKAKELVDVWRESRPATVSLWYDVEEAAMNAVKTPGTTFAVNAGQPNMVRFKKSGSFLLCQLPGGRIMSYPFPKIEEIDTPWGKKKMALTYMYEDTFTKKWTRGPTYGGSLVENCIQGLCRDLMGEALIRASQAKLPVVLHVHDEIVCEVPDNKNYTARMLENSMNEVPMWAVGFPIDSKGFETLRYRKD